MTAALPWSVWVAVGALTLALFCGSLAVLAPGPVRLPSQRRRPGCAAPSSALTGATAATTTLIDGVLQRGGRRERLAVALERAGVRMRVQDLVLLVVVGAVVLGAAGDVLAGPLLGLLLAVAAPVLAKIWIGQLTVRRQRAFADQLDDSLQLMSSSLRAGHSLLQALASVATEAEQPSSEEFARIINETRVGRPLGVALDEAARRMNSEDFVWVTQAVAINREVGGNLAEVLEGVSHTIRERSAIRRQVKALAAEGKLSAVVLILLPFGIAGFLLVTNPGYLAKFTHSVLGYGLLGVAVVLLAVGIWWLSKTVQVKF